jgi:hypothetical protein
MGNKKNERKRLPTAKKLAADAADLPDPADPPRHSSSSTRPKPRPTYKGSTKNTKSSEPISKKARQSQAVTSESDAMDASDDAEVIEMEEDEDTNDEDEEDEEDDSEEDVKVKGKAITASTGTRSAPGM